MGEREKTAVLCREVLIHSLAAIRSGKSAFAFWSGPSLADRQRLEAWSHLSSMLSHAAVVSKLLSISPPAIKPLAELLEVAHDDAIWDRDARNDFEHLDERVGLWLNSDQPILEAVLPNREALAFLQSEWFVKRVLLYAELILVTTDRKGNRRETELQPLMESLNAVAEKCDAWLEASDPFQYIFPFQTEPATADHVEPREPT